MYTELIWLENVSDRTCVGFFAKLLSEKIRSFWVKLQTSSHIELWHFMILCRQFYLWENQRRTRKNKLIWIWGLSLTPIVSQLSAKYIFMENLQNVSWLVSEVHMKLNVTFIQGTNEESVGCNFAVSKT